MPLSILSTKLFIPPPRREMVPRPHLIERMDAGLRGAPGLTLVSAPAGFGKTTLVSEWIDNLRFTSGDYSPVDLQVDAATKGQIVNQKSKIKNRVAWFSLDEGDNDLIRFFVYFIAAMQQVEPGIGQNVQDMLRAEPPQMPPLDALIIALINDVSTGSAKIVLVLDDYHLIENQAIDEAMTLLINRMPPQMQLIITSRIDPNFPLSRLRVRGQLTEIRATDLRFSAEEAATFLAGVTNLPLSSPQIAALEKRTEGWIAGLQLAALSMRNTTNVSAFVEAFTGSHRYIIDYLAGEVLDRQPHEIRSFLLQTSILNRLSAPLCNAVTRQEDSQAMLKKLDNANLFLTPLDNRRHWYRYHHLFADLLRQQLLQNNSDAVGKETLTALHRRAGLWYSRQADLLDEPVLVSEALHHAIKAEEMEAAIELVARHAGPNLMRGNVSAVAQWLESLPPKAIINHPVVAIAQAWVLYFTNRVEETERFLHHAEQQALTNTSIVPEDCDTILAEVYMLRAWIANIQGNPDGAIELFNQSLDLLPEDHLRARGLNLLFLAGALGEKGELKEATKTLIQALSICRAAGNFLAYIGGTYALASLQLIQGRLQQARTTLQETLQWAIKNNLQQKPSVTELYLGLGELSYEQNDLVLAEKYLQTSYQVSRRGLMITNAPCSAMLNLARLNLAYGNVEGARQHLAQAQEIIQTWQPPSEWTDLISYQIRLQLALAARLPAPQSEEIFRAIVNWYRNTTLNLETPITSNREYEALTAIRVALACARRGIRVETALPDTTQMLKQLEQAAAASGRMGSLIEILAMQAINYATRGDFIEAGDALKQALTLAEPEGYFRVFVDEGPTMAALLTTVSERGGISNQSFIGKLIDAIKAEHPQNGAGAAAPPATPAQHPDLIEALSEREQEVLRLVAAGLSNKEISEELILAVSTVKRHMSNIYGKLKVNSRTQAVAKARELSLI